jgi:hypothetical protein
MIVAVEGAIAQDSVPVGCRLETKECQVCSVDEDGNPVCSTVGIACTPNVLVCDGSSNLQKGDLSPDSTGKNETVINKSE